ncbi:MAG: TrmH family RNA methyltransferase [Phycisphaerales bacterium]
MAPITIDDPNDPRLDPFRSLRDADIARHHNLFLIEGRFAVHAMLSASRYTPHAILLTPSAWHAMRCDIIEPAAPPSLPIYLIDREHMQQLTGFDMHRGCIAAAHRPAAPPTPDDILRESTASNPHSPILILEDLANHDNIGGIFRSAAALGAGAILTSPRCCDPLYRKAVRVSMATVLRIPFATVTPWPDALPELAQRHNLLPIALCTDPDARPAEHLDHIAAQARASARRIALILGAEGPGLSARARALATERIRIRMDPTVDSLNVVVAAAIALHRIAHAVP